ncbi:ELWxxDGT repeat protein [Flavobacterium microcysteis]|uniref:T9SS type A sorting domain-containing protein n=1 Tax=Flavobacterium microcysteis TaxID=2596891 RepID=A0A501Q144_9FLAO|nr:ELWxxDGT repeat protein [Flavobacterium microcysteis]TPD66054.1 T9SS type A sorting domain-containing protein [Flavobacterium microcysteis]
MKITLRIILFLLISIADLNSQTLDATLVELNFAGDSEPKNITKGQTKIYFSADDGYRGRELWVHNTLTNKTHIVKDINPYGSGINNPLFYIVGDILYFTANDGVHGKELWKSDGTESGTYMLKDINTTGDRWEDEIIGGMVANLIYYNGSILFSADDKVNGQELWITDGTPEGTNLLKDIFVGPESSAPFASFVFNNYVYFACNDEVHGRELWKTDGTAAGTQLLKDINPGSGIGYHGGHKFIIFNNNFYFFGTDGGNKPGLWKSDGTTAGTQFVKNLNPNGLSSASEMNGSVTSSYFVFVGFTNTTGEELWKSDGTSAGTIMLKDINPLAYSGLSNEDTEFVTFNNKVFFTAQNSIYDEELWSTDGTTNGTQLVKDIYPGSYGSSLSKLTLANNYLIFTARDNIANPYSLWRSDGTSNGTFEIKRIDLSYNPDLNFVPFNNYVYFQGGFGSLNGSELMKTDGTDSGTQVVHDVNHVLGSYERSYQVFNDKIVFVGSDGFNGSEPFISDGTTNGTKMIKNINPTSFSIPMSNDSKTFFAKAGNNLFFRATNGTNGYEIFKTDGTEAGTIMLKDIAAGTASSIRKETLFMTLNNTVFFQANDQIHGEELWRSDGTENGTYLLKDINPGTANGVVGNNLHYNNLNNSNLLFSRYSSHRNYGILNGYLYFVAHDGVEYSIWKTDGTTAGTTKAITMPLPSSNMPEIIDVANGKIFFTVVVNNPTSGNDTLWSTDGTQAGTVLLSRWTNTSSYRFSWTAVVNDQLYFSSDGINGYSIMKSDGTVNGTISVIDNLPLRNQEFTSFMSCGNYIYFSFFVQNQINNHQLWRTDGTPTGTSFIEAQEGGGSCTCLQNNFFFTKNLGASPYDNKIWHINNNMQQSNVLQINVTDADNLIQSSGVRINQLIGLNNRLGFEGITKESGNELYFADIQNILNLKDFDNENNLSNKIKIYPNPSNGLVSIWTYDNSKIKDIEIYNLLGNKMHYSKDNLISDSLDLSNLSSGVYLIKVKTENYIETKKIILK